MHLLTTVKTTPNLAGQLKFAQLLESSEKNFERGVRELEANPLFGLLRQLGVLNVEPYSKARFASRRFTGQELRISSGSSVDLVDGRSDRVRLIESIGQESFETCFLRDESPSDKETAFRCRITLSQVRDLRDFVDKLYVHAEFDHPVQQTPTENTFSAVAAIEIDQGRPVLGFFNREIWKGRYQIHEGRRQEYLESLPHRQAKKTASFLRELEFVDLRKSTLYRILEILIETHATYFSSRNPADRRPLTQQTVAERLQTSPSVVNRLISNKSLQLPWGLETPMKNLFPSSKSLMRDRLFDLASANRLYRDKDLRHHMARLHGAYLSRQSITQYRKELGLDNSRSQTYTKG